MTKYFWDMKKNHKLLVWDSFSVTNRNSHKFFEIPYVLTHAKVVNKDIYFGEEIVNLMRDAIRKKVEKNINYPSKIAKNLYSLEKNVVKITSIAQSTDLTDLSDKDLIGLFDRCFEQIGMMECFMSYRGTVQLCDVLTEIIKQALAAKLNKMKKLELLDDHFLLLSTPEKESFFILLQNEILRIGSLIQEKVDNKTVQEAIRKLHKDYSWTGCVMFEGEHISIEKFRKEINSRLKLNCKAELEKYGKEKKQREQKIMQLIEEMQFSEEEKLHLENIREWCFLRGYAKDAVSKAIADTMLVLFEIAKRKNIDKNDIACLRKKEIDNIFNASKESLLKIILERENAWGAEAIMDKITFYTGKDLKKIEEIEEEDLDVKEISGQIASKGKVQGIVRFVKDTNELDKVKENDILVTSMTTTDFTPVLDKISAIVTDEGGLTCHAAIVSRELNIPCIIGTKIVTKVLKDNDKVEVDADNGVVRKLD